MKKSALIFIVSVLLSAPSWSKMQVQLSYSTFYSPSSGSYVEFYLSFVARDIQYTSSEEGYSGEIEVSYVFLKDDSVAGKRDFVVQTPYVEDSMIALPPFVSQHRVFLDNGDYTVAISIRDMHSGELPVVTEQKISLNYNAQLVALSDIELFQSSVTSNRQSMFQKSGFEIIPYPYDVVPKEMNQIGFYVELYNVDKKLGMDSAFLITYYLEDFDDGGIVTGFRGFSRKRASALNVIMGKFLVGDLAEGNYNVRVDVLDRRNKLITSKKISFHKENPRFIPMDAYTSSFVDLYTNADSLAAHIKYLEPIADRLEWEFALNQLNGKDLDLMKKYFLNFWQQRNADAPEKAWEDYYRLVNITIENFSSPMLPGYLTDRGYRYLKYGPPDDRYESFDEPRAFPYEIWYYTKVNNQSNRMIVFYNPTQVLNDFEILHSDINGELYNNRWELEINRLTPGVMDDENPRMPDHFGNRTKEWQNLPR